jgi:hypothetical protein
MRVGDERPGFASHEHARGGVPRLLNNVVVSRSSKPERVAENLDVFDFTLAPDHMTAIGGLHDGTRVLHDPMVFTGT